MKFSENWLRSRVSIAADREALVARLTMAGLEVEGVESIGEGLEHVVVGRITACAAHPDADRLKVCSVDDGSASPRKIVCGAPNARIGLKAPLALPGARLPNGVAIKASAVRGVDSAGMLCSSEELGLGAGASGLLELAADAPVGAPISIALALPDAAIELKLTPNRPDCLGIEGLALEVGALFDAAVAPLAIAPAAVSSSRAVAVRIDDPASCPRYLGRIIDGIDATRPTPAWIGARLARAGLRPISLVVDITHYVMLELGQPLHAFDADALDGGIVVRRALAGEALVLLDGREVMLDAGFVVIADQHRALALAGIMGGDASRVTLASSRVFLESAHFAPDAIAGRARRLGLSTDAAHRFERGVDPALPERALERATALMLAHGGGAAGPITRAEHVERLRTPAPIALRRARIARVLGFAIDDARVETILRGLGMSLAASADGWRVTAPTRRFDIAIEEDLIEEVIRVHGYDALPMRAPAGGTSARPTSEAVVTAHPVRARLASRGYLEAMTLAFNASATLAAWGDAGAVVRLANPLSADLDVMRISLLPGLVASVQHNLNRQTRRVRLFEIARTFAPGNDGPVETERLALVATGSALPEGWANPARGFDWYDLRGDVEAILALGGDEAIRNLTVEAGGNPWLHPGRSARIARDGKTFGWIGALHPQVAKALDLDAEVFVAELDFAALSMRSIPRSAPISTFPRVRRDIAVVVAEAIPYAAVEAAIRRAGGPFLREILPFDEFRGKGLPALAKSLAIGLILQEESRTLTDPECDAVVDRVVTELGAAVGAKLRD